ncbi:MAG: hypothetical protein AUG09_04000 [Acidobacteria bacterium 13_1_20CM_2_68_7]|nr:MAG: hypothetical protein AUG09_04000 [Acidobacteria bacterium 13_1_20CM_2_68_7]
MIARLWRGVTAQEKSQPFLEQLERTGVKDCAATPGNRGVLVLRRPAERGAEYLFISLWDSIDAIARFAGPDIDKAVYYPEDRQYLLDLETGVAHYEVAVSAARSLFAQSSRPGAGGGNPAC